jgi:hypothetical protein
MASRRRKGRTQIPTEIAARVLFLADRVCCVCRSKGKAVQIHHIDEDPVNNDEANLAVLCFDCHRETQIKGGFGRNLDFAQVVLYRDDWNEVVARDSTRRKAQSRDRSPASGENVSEALYDAGPAVSPRRLKDYQKNCIRESLAAIARHPGGLQMAVHAATGSDSDDYAHDFKLLFLSVPFHIGKWGLFQDHEEIASGDRYGVWVRWSSEKEKEYNLPPVGRTLVDALRRCGVDVTPLDLKGDAFLELIVYRRRPE